MELSPKDKKILKKNYSDKEIEFIENHLDEVIFCHPTRDDQIDADTARKILGSELFLSGLAAGVFSKMAIRKMKKKYVGFYRVEKEKDA